jgi:hypothetical protein
MHAIKESNIDSTIKYFFGISFVKEIVAANLKEIACGFVAKYIR